MGCLAKLNFVALLPGAVLALALLAWRELRRGERRNAALGTAAALALPAAAVAVYVALNEWVWDRSALGGGVEEAAKTAAGADAGAAGPISLTGQLGYTWQLYLPRLPFMNDQFDYFPPYDTWFQGLIGRFGWLDTSFHLWVYRLAVAVCSRSCCSPPSRPGAAVTACGRGFPSWSSTRRWWAGCSPRSGSSASGTCGTPGSRSSRPATCSRFLPLYGGPGGRGGAGCRAALVAPGGRRCWCVLAVAHGLFAQLLVISRFYG